MVTIKIGKKRIKVINWIKLFICLIVFIYLFFNAIYLLPVFKTKLNYNIDNNNYKINANITFKTKFSNCIIKENLKLTIKDKKIKSQIINDYKKDGYSSSINTLKKEYKVKSSCDKLVNNYKSAFNIKINKDYLDVNIKYNENKELTIDNYTKKEGNYDNKKLGTYYITFENKNNIFKNKLYMKVNVIDNESPVIRLIGKDVITINLNDKYNEPGYSSFDNYDGDLTKKVIVKNDVNEKVVGDYEIKYLVKDSSGNKTEKTRKIKVIKNVTQNTNASNSLTYINGILVVNKKYSLPKDYNPGVNKEAYDALKIMQADAKALGLNLSLQSGYRSYSTQTTIYNNYVKKYGVKLTDTFSARPGHSEHQTGLAFDVGKVEDSFANTKESKWLEQNAHLYGFIIRYPKGKQSITGYKYEPWHIRYLGKENAKKIKESGKTLEEYLNIN